MDRYTAQQKKRFERAYDALFEQIFGFLARRLGDRERAKELAQETFMRAWMHLANGKKIHVLRPYLYTTAYNLFKNELRAKKGDTTSLDDLMESTGFEPTSSGQSPKERSIAREIFESIEQLPVLYQESILLRYRDGLPVKDIAERLDESQSTIAVRIHRGLRQLKHHYDHAHRYIIRSQK